MCQLDDDPTVGHSQASKMLREACRVLRPGGHYVCLTYGRTRGVRGSRLKVKGLRFTD